MRCVFLGVVVLTLAAGPAAAQRRLHNSLALRSEAQLEVALDSVSYLWGGVRDMRSPGEEFSSPVNEVQMGYERFWNRQWSWGGGGRVIFYNMARNPEYIPELLLRHRSPMGPITLGQRLSLEYSVFGGDLRNQGLARLRLDAERLLQVGKVTLRPRVAAEAGATLRIQPPEELPEERTIDVTQLRAEMGIRLSDRLDLTPYFARQTLYYITQPQFDMNGNVTIPGGKRQIITPVLGLDVRLTLFRGKEAFERVQLPTQH